MSTTKVRASRREHALLTCLVILRARLELWCRAVTSTTNNGVPNPSPLHLLSCLCLLGLLGCEPRTHTAFPESCVARTRLVSVLAMVRRGSLDDLVYDDDINIHGSLYDFVCPKQILIVHLFLSLSNIIVYNRPSSAFLIRYHKSRSNLLQVTSDIPQSSLH